MGRISSGGIAGVASQAKGPSIKRVNDQDDYSKWEFYYDPSKDTGMMMPVMGAQQPGLMQGAAPGVNQNPNAGAQNPNAGFNNQPANTPADNGTDNSVVVGGQQQQAPAGQPTVVGPSSPLQTNRSQ